MRAPLLLPVLTALLATACSSTPKTSPPPKAPAARETRAESASKGRSRGERCDHCGEPLSGNSVIFEHRPLHERCLAKVVPPCGICRKPLLGMIAMVGPGPGYHEHCFAGAHRCDACSLPAEGERGGVVTLDDGRRHCGECAACAVTDAAEARSLAKQVIHDLRRILAVDIRRMSWTLKLVDSPELKRIAGSDRDGIKGWTDARRRVRRGRASPWEVTVYILEKEPSGAVYGVLAHELFHLWQLHNAPLNVRAELREGAANWVQWRLLKARGVALWPLLLEADPDPVYGDGFRRFQRFVARHGWPRTLDRMSRMTDFPDSD